jgi:Lon protease-like protein
MTGAKKSDELPVEFPVFPLAGALLLPGGRLPLNIFEPRYLAMIDDAMAHGRVLGMVQPDKRLAHGDNGPGLYRIGCLGRITSFSETDDGRYLITLAGLTRFTIVEEVEPARGYRRVRAALGGFAPDLEQNSDEVDFDRTALLAALRRYFATAQVDANWEAISAMSDAALIVSLCMACPFDPEEKQALLEARDEPERARALLALLEINAFDDRMDDDEEPKAS